MTTYHLCTDTSTYSELPNTLSTMNIAHCAIKLPLYFDVEPVGEPDSRQCQVIRYITGTITPISTLDRAGTTFIIKDMTPDLMTYITLRGLPILLLELSVGDQTALFPESFSIVANHTAIKFLD